MIMLQNSYTKSKLCMKSVFREPMSKAVEDFVQKFKIANIL